MSRLWARNTTFNAIDVGDELPILVKWETAETIAGFRQLVCPNPPDSDARDETEVLPPAAAVTQCLVSYVTELLEKGFPFAAITAEGSSLSLRVLEAVKPEDTISLTGEVVAKAMGEANGSVECLVRIENQDSQLVATATAQIVLDR